MKMENGKTRNFKMDDEVYKLRRQVIEYIYEAKEVVDLPRITVRITENHATMLGCARLYKNILWITQRAISNYNLRAIVYHEIAHAVFGAKHNEKCPLMKPVHFESDKMTKNEAQQALLKTIKG